MPSGTSISEHDEGEDQIAHQRVREALPISVLGSSRSRNQASPFQKKLILPHRVLNRIVHDGHHRQQRREQHEDQHRQRRKTRPDCSGSCPSRRSLDQFGCRHRHAHAPDRTPAPRVAVGTRQARRHARREYGVAETDAREAARGRDRRSARYLAGQSPRRRRAAVRRIRDGRRSRFSRRSAARR